MKLNKNQQGASHIIVILLLLVLVGVGFAAYRVYTNNKNSDMTKNTNQTATTETNDATTDQIKDTSDLEEISNDLQNLDLDKELDTTALEEDISQIQ